MSTILNAALMYWVLLFALRLVGRRGPNMMTPFEMIVIFLLGGLAIQAIVGEDRSLTNALLGIMTVVLMHVLVSTLKGRYPAFGKVVDGTLAADLKVGMQMEVTTMPLYTNDDGVERIVYGWRIA